DRIGVPPNTVPPAPSPVPALNESPRGSSGSFISSKLSHPLSLSSAGRSGAGGAEGGDPNGIGGRRVVPCATDSDERRSGAATTSQARSRPPIPFGGAPAATGPAPERSAPPLRTLRL